MVFYMENRLTRGLIGIQIYTFFEYTKYMVLIRNMPVRVAHISFKGVSKYYACTINRL